MATVRIPDLALAHLALPADPLVVIVEGVEKPGNLGAVVRSADGAGADGVIVTGPGADPFNPNAIRASLGAIFHVPIAVATPHEAVALRWPAASGSSAPAWMPNGSTPRRT